MHIQTHEHQATGIKFYIIDGSVKVARAYLYILQNDLHSEPFGYIEDIFTHSKYRGNGYASALLGKIIAHAKKVGCYKLILITSKSELVEWYTRYGFVKRGTEMRIDF